MIVILGLPIFCQRPTKAGSDQPMTLRLWPGGAPGTTLAAATGETTAFPAGAWVAGKSVTILGNVSEPTLTLYAPPRVAGAPMGDASDLSAAVVVFPGGGYNILAYDLEGSEVCSWLNRLRIACVLVKYRVPDSGPYPKFSAALQDAQRAFGLVRDHAASWNIDPNRIGEIGFSAGGHLAAALASHSVERLYAPIDHSDLVSCRPDFEMLIYPAYLSAIDGSLELAPAVQPLASTPPVFIVQSEDDPVHVENAIAYFVGLKREGLSAEMHLYPKGGHGYGLRRTDNTVTGWPGEAQKWLISIHMLSSAQ